MRENSRSRKGSNSSARWIAILTLSPAQVGGRLLLAASDGKAVIAPIADVIAETCKGRQVINVLSGERRSVVRIIAVSSVSASGKPWHSRRTSSIDAMSDHNLLHRKP